MPFARPRARARLPRPLVVGAVLVASLALLGPGQSAVAAGRTTTGLAGVPSAPARALPAAVPGDPTSGDSLFPDVGNRGYRTNTYDIDVDFTPATTQSATTSQTPATVKTRATVKSPASIRARTTISLTPDHPLSSIPLDFEGLTVDSVTVGGRPAAWSRSGHKLVVTPAAPVTDVVSVVVAYHGVPVTHIDPDGAEDGWVPTADGATVVSEPVGAMTWFPNNNTPRDKATYRVNVTVPNDLQVAGNGDLTRVSASPGRTTWRWAMHEPMASYLAMISIGRYRVYQSQMPYLGGLSSLPLWSFVDVTLGSRDQARVDLRDALRWEQKEFGLYPFDSSGIVIDVTGVGYALETQSRPVFDRTADRSTIVHEMAHQWFGDAVSLSDWGDIWLNEGFATYTEWLFAAAHGGPTTAQAFRAAYDAQPATSDFWTVAPHGLTDPAQLFSSPVYERGAMTLAALSQRIGAPTLQRVLRSWTLHHQGGTGTTAQFVALAEQISGAQLGPLFHRWLDVPTRPAFP